MYKVHAFHWLSNIFDSQNIFESNGSGHIKLYLKSCASKLRVNFNKLKKCHKVTCVTLTGIVTWCFLWLLFLEILAKTRKTTYCAS